MNVFVLLLKFFFFSSPLPAAHSAGAGLFFVPILSTFFLCLITPSQKINKDGNKEITNVGGAFSICVCVRVCLFVGLLSFD